MGCFVPTYMNPFHRENAKAVEYAVTDSGAGETLLFDNGSTIRAVIAPTGTDNNNVPGGTNNENSTTIQVVPEHAIRIGLRPSQNFTYSPQPGQLVRMKIGSIVKTPSYWEIRCISELKTGQSASGIPGI